VTALTGQNVSLFTNNANYITSASAPVQSVFGRSGAVTANSGDYSTSQVTESGNLYFTNARADARINATTTIGTLTSLPNLSLPASQLTNFGTPFYTFFNGTTTDALGQGSTNKYYATSLFNTDFASKSTTNLAEGTNLYFTNARVNSYVDASTTIAKAYSANTFTNSNTFSGGLTVGSLSGPLQAINGMVSASSTISSFYGGTGISTPSVAGILLGNYAGNGWQQIATSSLGLLSTNVAEGSNLYFTNARADARINATTTIGTITSLPNLSLSATQLTNFGLPFYTFFNGTTTDALTQGATNKYFSNALAQAAITNSATGLTYSAGNFSLTSGYNIPLTASTTNWNNFFNTPSSQITAGTNLAWAGNTLNVTGLTTSQWTTSGANIYYNTGNVGVGTTTPFTKFSVAGNGYFDGTVTATNITATGTATFGNGGLTIDSSGNMVMSFADSFSVGSYVRLGNGYVQSNAIAPNAPNTTFAINNQPFSVAGNAVQIGYGTNSNSSGTFTDVLISPTYNQTGTGAATDLLINRTQTAIGSGLQRLIDTQVAGVSQFNVSNTGQGYFAGNVGIATTSPGSALSVNGNAYVTGSVSSNSVSTVQNIDAGLYLTGNWVTSATGIYYSQTAANGITLSPFQGIGSSALNGAVAGVLINPIYNQVSGSAANTDLLINRTQTAIGSGVQRLIDAQVAGASKFNVSNTGQAYFAGSVGIGTTSPSAKLSITGPDTSTGRALVIANSANTELWSVDDTGRISVGAGQTFTIRNNTNSDVLTISNANVHIAAGSLNIDNGGVQMFGGSTPTNGLYTSGFASDILVNNWLALSKNAEHTLKPVSDSTTAIQISNAAATPFVTFDTTNQRVGIGTISPAEKLQVDGNIKVGSTYNNTIYFGDTNWGLQVFNTGANDYANRIKYAPDGTGDRRAGFYNSNTGAFTLYSDTNVIPNIIIPTGKIGIGTTSPQSTLSVQGASAPVGTPIFSVASSTQTNIFTVLSDTMAGGGVAVNNNSTTNVNGHYAFYVNGTSNFTSPITVQSYITASATAFNATNYDGLTITNGGGTSAASTDSITLIHENSAFTFYNGVRLQSSITANTAGSETSDFNIQTRNAGTLAERLRITGAGNVGIGSSSPTYGLTVNPTSGVAAYQTAFFQDSTPASGVTRVIIKGGPNQNNIYQSGALGIINQNGGGLVELGYGNGSDVRANKLTSLNSGTLTVRGSQDNGGIPGVTFSNFNSNTGNNDIRTTSGTAQLGLFSTSFIPTSGTGVFNVAEIAPIINQTGGANGITRGLYVNPTLTAAADFRGLEIASTTGSNFALYQESTTGKNYFGGSVGIGTTSPASTLTVVGSACISKGTGATAACSTTAGTITANAFNTAAADLAERYKIQDTSIEAGDIVALDSANAATVKKAATPKDQVLGIISTEPGFLLGSTNLDDATSRPVALSGRVPVKFSNENGEVKIGDALTLSATKPGYAMKIKDAAGVVIGTALENASTENKVMVFVRSSLISNIALGDTAAELLKTDTSLQGEFATLLAGTGEWMQARVSGVTGFFKNIFADKVTTKELCLGDATDKVCVTKDQLKTLLNNAGATAQTQPVIITPATSTSSGQVTPLNLGGVTGGVSSTTPIITAPATTTPAVAIPPVKGGDASSAASSTSPTPITSPVIISDTPGASSTPK
jgi:hypothetical protein